MMEVDYCPNCRGLWLDYKELDRLEDAAFDEDRFKGSLIHHEVEVGYHCPICDQPMREFRYRLYDLKLELCPEHHGFWLDAGEDDHILQIMTKKRLQLAQQIETELEWKKMLRGLHSFVKKS